VVPSTWPGSRAPHAWLTADQSLRGASTLDWFGRDWVLVGASDTPADPAAPARAAIEAACRVHGVELRHRTLPSPAHDRLYERRWVLVRPDGHVAWRGDALPESARPLIEQVLGHDPRH
jgi:hypothetical protein